MLVNLIFIYSEKDHFAVKSKLLIHSKGVCLYSEKDHFAVKSKLERYRNFKMKDSEKDHFAVKSKPVSLFTETIGDSEKDHFAVKSKRNVNTIVGEGDSEKDHFAVKSKLFLSNYFLHYQYISLFSCIKRLIYFAHFSSLCNLCHKEARRLTQLARNRHYARAHQ